MSVRMGRINAEMQKSISITIQSKLKDPRVSGMVSVTKIDCAKDLKTAKVYVSSLGGDLPEIVEGLKASAGFIRRELSSDLRDIRTVPELIFIADETVAAGERIDAILNEIKSSSVEE